jgi:hypothetical protein
MVKKQPEDEGEYFANMNLAGELFSRIDSMINFSGTGYRAWMPEDRSPSVGGKSFLPIPSAILVQYWRRCAALSGRSLVINDGRSGEAEQAVDDLNQAKV